MGNSTSAKVENSFFNRPAYQVVHVVKESPADRAGLMPYFDFLTYLPPVRTFTNSPLPYDEFVRDVLARQPTLELMVFNCATARVRKVHLQPARYGNGPLDLTGFIMRATIISEAISQVEHVQDVSIGSPAFNVGLVPNFDYIIATDDGNCFDLHQIIRAHNPNDCLRVYVVDIFLRASRVVQIPGLTVLGERRFGCTLASGYLHRIPSERMTFYLARPSGYLSRGNSVEAAPMHYHTEEASSGQCHGHEHLPSSSHNGSASALDHSHHRSRSSSTGPSSVHPAPQLNGHSKPHRKRSTTSTSSQPDPPAPPEPVDPNSCVFVTRLQLDAATVAASANSSEVKCNPADHGNSNGTSAAASSATLPISVQIPRDIVTNVVADLVRYQKEHQQAGGGSAKSEVQSSS